jgi:hypothetical protein
MSDKMKSNYFLLFICVVFMSCDKDISVPVGKGNYISVSTSDLSNGLVANLLFDGILFDQGLAKLNFSSSGVSYGIDRKGIANRALKLRGVGFGDYVKASKFPANTFNDGISVLIYFNPSNGNVMDGNGNASANGASAILAFEGDGIGTPPGFFVDYRKLGAESRVGYYFTNGCCDARSFTTNLNSFSSIVETNKWYKLLVVANKKSFKFYLDGKLQFEKQLNSDFNILNSLNLHFGIYGYGNEASKPTWYPFNGLIDDFSIWNRELTAEEIALVLALN